MNNTEYEQCRACLNNITTAQNIVAEDQDQTQATNSLLSENLFKLFLDFTTLDVSQEVKEFPKHLCQLCLDKLFEFDEFRKKALASTRILHQALKDKNQLDIGEKYTLVKDEMLIANSFVVKEEQTMNDSEIDPKAFCEAVIDGNDTMDFNGKVDENEYYDSNENIDGDANYEGDEDYNAENGIDAELNSSELHRNQPDCNFQAKDAQWSPIYGRFSENNDNEICGSSICDEYDNSVNSEADMSVPGAKEIKGHNFNCVKCNKQFMLEINLKAHELKVHQGIKRPYRCQNCPAAYSTKQSLVFHIFEKCIAKKQKPYSCQKCNKAFTTKSKLNMHIYEKCGASSENLQIKIIKPTVQKWDSSFTCKICEKPLKNMSSLRNHMKRHLDAKNYKCPKCDAFRATNDELKIHMRVHDENKERFQCPQCPQMFTHKISINRHVRAVHEGVRRYSCSHCPKRFGTHVAQLNHEKNIHDEGRNFICDICNRGFKMEKSLVNHLKNHRKLNCNLCSNLYTNLKTLADHQKVHLGDNALICNICSHGFINLADLQDHINQHAEHQNASSEDMHPKSPSKRSERYNDENSSKSLETANRNKGSGSQKKTKKNSNTPDPTTPSKKLRLNKSAVKVLHTPQKNTPENKRSRSFASDIKNTLGNNSSSKKLRLSPSAVKYVHSSQNNTPKNKQNRRFAAQNNIRTRCLRKRLNAA